MLLPCDCDAFIGITGNQQSLEVIFVDGVLAQAEKAAAFQQRPQLLQLTPTLCESFFGHAFAPKDLKGNVFTAVRETGTDGVFEQYLAPSRQWVTVTPVLLNGYDTKHGKKNLKKRQKMLTKMFRVVGLPVPKAIQTFAASEKFDVSNKHGKNYIQTMLAVEFDTEVAGMLVIGAGRNSGMGVFANLAASATN